MGGIQVTPYRPQSENLLDQVTKITALKNAQQESALRNQEVISATRQNEQTQAVNSAYHDAITMDESGQPKIDSGKLTKALAANGHGSAVPGILKSIQDYQKSATDLQEAKGKIQSQASEAMGFLGSAIQKANYDPNLADLMIEQHLRSPNASPQEISQLQQMRSQIQQNPQMLKTLADSYVAQAPKQQEFQNAKDVANIRSQSEGKMQMAAWLRDNPTRQDGTPNDASDYQKFLNQQGIDATVAKETNPKVLQARKDLAVSTAQAEAPAKIATAAAEERARQQIAGMAKPVYAIDATTGHRVPVSQTEALSDPKRYSLITPVSEKDIEDDRQLNNRLADVSQKISEYQQSFTNNLSLKDKALLAGAIGHGEFKLGVSGHAGTGLLPGGNAAAHAEIPLDAINNLLAASETNGLSQAGQQRLIAYRNAAEAMIGYQRILSGSGRSSDKQIQLNTATLPHPLNNQDFAKEGFRQFGQNLTIAAQGLPDFSKFGIKSPTDTVEAMRSGGLPQGKGQVIDKATALKFYQAAGNDPDKARKLATDNGWKLQ